MWKRVISLFLILCLLTTLVGCGGWNPIIPPNPNPNEPLEPIIPGTTKVLEDLTIRELLSVTEDQDTTAILFENPTLQLEELAVGDIIVMGVTEHTPEGLLRKVKSITKGGKDGSIIVVETEFATLEEAIEQGEFCFDEALKAEDAEEPVCYIEGIKFIRDKSIIKDSKTELLEFTYDINVIIYDGDNNPNTEIDNITLTGKISFDYHLIFSGKVGVKGCPLHCHSYLKELTFKNRVEIEKNLGVTVGGSVELFSYEKKLWTQDLGLKTFFIGVVPVVLHPTITIVANVEGEIFAEVTAEVTDKDTYTAGIKLEDGDWDPISSHVHDFYPPSLTLSAGGDVTFGVGPKLKCTIYGVLGPYCETTLYGKAIADVFDNPWWKLYAGIIAKTGIKIEIFSKTYGSAEKIVLDLKKIIAKADGPFGNGQ